MLKGDKMGHCKDCNWWDRWDDTHLGIPFNDEGFHICALTWPGEKREVTDRALFFATTGYLDETWVQTSPEFGCVQFEAKMEDAREETPKVYEGIIRETDYGENSNALFVGNADSPFAEQIRDDIDD